jgi:molybdopterin-guanine dinucleotide biosynthesis protein B
VAIATDETNALPEPTNLDILDLNDPEMVADWLMQHQDRFIYQSPLVNP